MEKYYLGIDIGATFIRFGIITVDGKIVLKDKYTYPKNVDEYSVSKLIISKYLEYRQRLGINIDAIGIGAIGPLDLEKGDIVNTPNAPVRNHILVRPIINTLKKPVYLANDAVASAWGEYVFYYRKNIDNLVYITISTGIGGGVIVDSNLLIGKHGNAHEIGHIVVDYNGSYKCGCGGIGHWEGIASGGNMVRNFYIYLESRWRDLKGRYIVRSPSDIFSLYRKGDAVAIDFIENVVLKSSIAGIASVANVYDPEIIVIGGSIALNNWDIFKPHIDENIDKHLIVAKPKIEITHFGDDIGILGGAALAIDSPVKIKSYTNRYLRLYS